MKYKPCYHCGTFNPDLKKYYLFTDNPTEEGIFVGYYIHCTGCGVNGYLFRKKYKAVKHWNGLYEKKGKRLPR